MPRATENCLFFKFNKVEKKSPEWELEAKLAMNQIKPPTPFNWISSEMYNQPPWHKVN